ncbi:hypothetical protein ACFLYO_08290 [Chloroflexota bacterium]
MMIARWGVFLFWLVLLVGCTTGPVATPLPTQALVPSTATPEPLPPTPTVVVVGGVAAPVDVVGTPEQVAIPAAAQIMVGLVVDDLAEQLAESSTAIVLRAVQEVVWQDTDLGCNLVDQNNILEPLMGGAELVSISGYRITLLYQDELYQYHTDDRDQFELCLSRASIPDGEPVIIDTLLGSMVDIARHDLASQLDLPLRRVFVVEATAIVWPDGSLGCQLVDQEFEQTPVPGYRIVLRAGPEHYTYHGNYRQVRFCPTESVRLPEDMAGQLDVTPTLDSGE